MADRRWPIDDLWQAWRMNISLAPRQETFLRGVREFTEHDITPKAGELDRAGDCPPEIIDGLARRGLLGTFVPADFGGAGEDYVSYIAALEEISAAWAALGAIL